MSDKKKKLHRVKKKQKRLVRKSLLLKARRQDTVIHEELARVRGRGTILLAAEISRPRSKILSSRPLALDLQPSQKNEKRAIRKTSLVVFDVHAIVGEVVLRSSCWRRLWNTKMSIKRSSVREKKANIFVFNSEDLNQF